MAKKKKKKKPNKNSVRRKPKAPESGKKSRIPVIALIAGSVLVIIGAYYLYQIKKPPSRSPQLAQVQKETGSLREKRQTLSPHGFTGKVRRAYEVARAIPEVLDRLYCYCRCRENFGHKNLLSCFVDTHAST